MFTVVNKEVGCDISAELETALLFIMEKMYLQSQYLDSNLFKKVLRFT